MMSNNGSTRWSAVFPPVRPLCLFLFAASALCAHGGTVSVQARDAVTNAPLANVELKLRRSAEPVTEWSARTDTQGKAEFEDLSAGRYFLQWYREGYIDPQIVSSKNLRIKDGGSSEEVKIKLAPATRLEGTVLDENGWPMEGVVAYTSGNRSTSGRDGRYRLANLSAGAAQIEFRVPLELRKKTLHRDPETGEIWGYPAVQFYPGVVDRASATLMQLAAGMELQGFDVRLQRMRLVDFSGRTVTRAGGEALAPAHVRLLTAGVENSPDETLETRAVGGDGSFRFELIRSGSYVLLVYRGDAGTGLPYRVSVEVGQNGVLAREFVVPVFPTIRVVLRAKDDAKWQGDVTLIVMAPHMGPGIREVTLRPTGELALPDLPPGQWQIGFVTNAVRLADQHKLAITNVRFGVSNPQTGTIAVMESGNPPLEIELSSDTGRIAGTVKGPHSGLVLVEKIGTPRFFAAFRALLTEDGGFLTDELAPGL